MQRAQVLSLGFRSGYRALRIKPSATCSPRQQQQQQLSIAPHQPNIGLPLLSRAVSSTCPPPPPHASEASAQEAQQNDVEARSSEPRSSLHEREAGRGRFFFSQIHSLFKVHRNTTGRMAALDAQAGRPGEGTFTSSAADLRAEQRSEKGTSSQRVCKKSAIPAQ